MEKMHQMEHGEGAVDHAPHAPVSPNKKADPESQYTKNHKSFEALDDEKPKKGIPVIIDHKLNIDEVFEAK